MAETTISKEQLYTILNKVYSWSENQNFRGYNKHDGLNSPSLKLLLGWGKWPRIIAIQSIMRSPINIRPLFGIKKTYNPKGLALFIQGSLDLYQCTKDIRHLQDVETLLDVLYKIKSPGEWSGNCWGYHYPWQDPGFFAPSNTPNAVVTCFVCEAFLDAYLATKNPRYLETVASAIDFFLNDLTNLKDTPEELCLAYMPLPMSMRVMDVSILIGSVIARYGKYKNDTRYRSHADRLVQYVVNRQTDYAAWFYTDPPGDSHITHDNYHTGFILDALYRYMESTSDFSYNNHYNKGLEYYAAHLFNQNGSPKWMNDKNYPHDIHGAAQGIITFSQHMGKHPGLADSIANWAIDNMYNREGRFYYQETPYFKKRVTLLRWCNAWMYRALASLYKSRYAFEK